MGAPAACAQASEACEEPAFRAAFEAAFAGQEDEEPFEAHEPTPVEADEVSGGLGGQATWRPAPPHMNGL